MSSLRSFVFVFCFFCFTLSCFAYDIESYAKAGTAKSAGVLNFVFCPLNYPNKKDFLRDIEAIIQRLSRTKPFAEFMDGIGVWQVAISQDEERVFFKETPDFPPLKVRQDFLDHILAHINSTYKLIIIDASGSVSCAELSSKDKMSLIILGKGRYKDKDSFAKGFLHELGHSLGLRDECVDCGQLCPAGPPNCATTKKEAEEWWGDLVGKEPRVNYISGCCGNRNYIRPTIASLMNDPNKAEDFGPVNERYLRKVQVNYE
jgi:hypothetical protein